MSTDGELTYNGALFAPSGIAESWSSIVRGGSASTAYQGQGNPLNLGTIYPAATFTTTSTATTSGTFQVKIEVAKMDWTP